MKSLYDVLGVSKNAAADTIKAAYRRLARKFHPDVSKEPDAEAQFKAVREAYEILSDPERRARYDADGDTEKEPDPDHDARGILFGLFARLVDQLPPHIDLFEAMQISITETLGKIDKDDRSARVCIEKLTRRLNAVRRKDGGDNPFNQIVEDKIDGHRKNLASMAEARARYTRARELFAEFEGNPQPQWPEAAWFHSTATMAFIGLDRGPPDDEPTPTG